jgi:uncharacterized protein (DUF2147 family)
MKRVLFLFSFVLIATFTFAQDAEGDKLLGVWEPSHGKAKVKIEKIADKYYGKIVWLKEPTFDDGTPKTDRNNPDESLRSVPVKGLRILKDFTYKGQNTWVDGTIYDPENGSTYSSEIKMKDDNTLDIRGFIGVKTFGRTDTWKRLEMKK